MKLLAVEPFFSSIRPLGGQACRTLWDGTRFLELGCTPQSCGFRDAYAEFKRLGFEVFGVGAQRTEDQREFAQRNHIPYEILSDDKLDLARALRLPTFEVMNSPTPLVPRVCIKRLTMVVEAGRIRRVFYPVYPPDKNAREVISWLKENG